MNSPIRILFDECVGKPVVDSIAELLQTSETTYELRHILEFQSQGVRDEDWLPQRAAEGWILITSDGGRGGRRKGAKLPNLCAIHGMTHVILSSSLHSEKSHEKKMAIISVWSEICALIAAPAGSRYSLRKNQSGRASLVHVKREGS